jgi:hypothetical protein
MCHEYDTMGQLPETHSTLDPVAPRIACRDLITRGANVVLVPRAEIV